VKGMSEEEKTEFQKTIYVKGLGTITSVGELNMEKWIKSLLECKYITD
jgi:hypothetical protein